MDSIVVKNSEMLSSDMDGDVVMMSIEDGEYYSIDPTGARIWDLLKEPVKVGDICTRLLTEYDVGPEQCQKEMIAFLNKLSEKKIILVLDE